jgi:hypothetical protein
MQRSPYLGWLDLNDADLAEARRLVAAWREEESADPLGLRPLAQVFSNWFYPAITTQMTRARYFIFVPTICQYLERQRLTVQEFERRLTEEQDKLCKSLKKRKPEQPGIIGKRSGEYVNRRPMEIYWSGLRELGIFSNDWSIAEYSVRAAAGADEDLDTDESVVINERLPSGWDDVSSTGIVGKKGVCQELSFDLEPEERRYLKERFRSLSDRRGDGESTLFACVIRNKRTVPAPWKYPKSLVSDHHLRLRLDHSERFSAAARGIYIIYNTLVTLARTRQKLAKSPDADVLRRLFRGWWAAAQSLLMGWDLDEFERLFGPAVSERDRRDISFVRDIQRLFPRTASAPSFPDGKSELERLVVAREATCRPFKCRLCALEPGKTSHQSYLKQWKDVSAEDVDAGRANGAYHFYYRHAAASRILRDICGG